MPGILFNTILSTSGLIGYYPMYNSLDDATGFNEPLKGSVKELFGLENILTSSSYGSAYIEAQSSNNYSGLLYVSQPLDLLSMELWVQSQIPTDSSNFLRGVLGANMMLGSSYNESRILLAIQSGSSQVGYRLLNQVIQNISDNSIFNNPVHVVLQYEEDKNATVVYFNGELKSSLPGNGFSGLVSGGKLTPAGFTSNNEGWATSYFSDFAFYNRELTQSEILERLNNYYEEPGLIPVKIEGLSLLNSNTTLEDNQYPGKTQNVVVKVDSTLFAKTFNYSSIFDDKGELRESGYYQSTVLINDSPSSNRRVMCFTNNGQMIGETVSDHNGEYRFDHLDLNKKYMFVAQYSNELNTPPDYTAVAADWQTPIPYKE